MGRVSAPFGIQGWIKIRPFTERVGNLMAFHEWWVGRDGDYRAQQVAQAAVHGQDLIARLEHCRNREAAAALKGYEIAVPRDSLPESKSGEYYWDDLLGCEVVNVRGESLGVVAKILETGSNAVLVMRGERAPPVVARWRSRWHAGWAPRRAPDRQLAPVSRRRSAVRSAVCQARSQGLASSSVGHEVTSRESLRHPAVALAALLGERAERIVRPEARIGSPASAWRIRRCRSTPKPVYFLPRLTAVAMATTTLSICASIRRPPEAWWLAIDREGVAPCRRPARSSPRGCSPGRCCRSWRGPAPRAASR